MAWTDITRPKYQRDGLRYASDTTEAEWVVIAPQMPPPAGSGRTRKTSLREVVNAIFSIAQSGCQWRLLPSSGTSMRGAMTERGRSSTMCC
jgi:transposase